MGTTQEKTRNYPRYKAPKGMFIGWRSGAQRTVSRAEILGMGGLFLRTEAPLPVGSIIEMFFDLKTGEVRAQGIVRSSMPQKGMGVQFVRMQPTGRARFNQFLTQHASAESKKEVRP